MVTGGQLVDSADPIVKGRERFFEPVDDYMAKRSANVEEATAAPGERRSRGRAAKKANGKPKSTDEAQADEAQADEDSED